MIAFRTFADSLCDARRHERTDYAPALISLACGWFTEGFDTRDLREARTLLDTLT